MSGHVGDLTPNQADLLEKFRENVKDVLKPEQVGDDYFLTRWLRARSYDLEKSEAMLRASCAWRKQNKVDSILEDFTVPEVLKKYYPGGICGVDREGSPVWLDTTGYGDMRGILRSVKKNDVLLSKVHLLESFYNILFKETSKTHGKRIDSLVVVIDLDKFGMKHLWKPGVDVFLEIIQMVEDNYPETLKKSYVINAPRIFPILYKVVRPLLSEDTVRKVQILGSNYKEVLCKDIGPDQLPKYWGGNCEDPDGDPRCLSKVNFGGDVPKEYYRKMTSEEMENCVVTCVGRGSSLQLDYSIDVPNSILRWQFMTDGYDIGFGIYRKQSSSRQKASNMEQVMVSQRVNSHMVPEDGSLTCHETGIYVVRFDNTYSWTRSKTIHYFIELLEPEGLPDSAVMAGTGDIYANATQSDISDMYTSSPADAEYSPPENTPETQHIEENTDT